MFDIDWSVSLNVKEGDLFWGLEINLNRTHPVKTRGTGEPPKKKRRADHLPTLRSHLPLLLAVMSISCSWMLITKHRPAPLSPPKKSLPYQRPPRRFLCRRQAAISRRHTCEFFRMGRFFSTKKSPGSKHLILVMVIPPVLRTPYNEYINPYGIGLMTMP